MAASVALQQVKKDNYSFMTCILRVNVRSSGWQRTVMRVIRSTNGVSNFRMDENGMVEVSGKVDPSLLLKMLAKAGKGAEVCWFQFGQSSSNLYIRDGGTTNYYGDDNINNYYGGGGGGGHAYGYYNHTNGGGARNLYYGDNRYLQYEGGYYGDRPRPRPHPRPKQWYKPFHSLTNYHHTRGGGDHVAAAGTNAFSMRAVPPPTGEDISCCSLM